MASHIISEMYEIIFNGNIINDSWTEYDKRYLVRNEINLPEQINGKMEKTSLVDSGIEDENQIIEMLKVEYLNLIRSDI